MGKPLSPTRTEIASGLSDLPCDRVMAYRDLWASQGYDLPPYTEPPAGTRKKRKRAQRRGTIRLGDRVSSALALVGVTETRIARWLGGCGCGNRRKKLNRLSDWAESVTVETASAAKKKLKGLLR